MRYDDVVEIALKLPDVKEALSYNTPSLKRKGRFMLRLTEDCETIAVKLDWESHDRFLADYPDIIYKTEHYETWPSFLVRLDLLDSNLAKSLLDASWTNAKKPAKRRTLGP